MTGPRRATFPDPRDEPAAAGSLESPENEESRAPGRRPRGTPRDRALRLLGVRWRSREELRRRLSAAGFEAAEVEATIRDLERAGLVDDARFAAEMAEALGARRLGGNRAVRAALRGYGVDPEVGEAAMAALPDEEERAARLATARARSLRGLPFETAYRRLEGALMRRGFAPRVAREAARRVLSDAGPGQLDPDEAP